MATETEATNKLSNTLDNLERRNNDLKTRLADYKDDKSKDMNAFKDKFNNDIRRHYKVNKEHQNKLKRKPCSTALKQTSVYNLNECYGR